MLALSATQISGRNFDDDGALFDFLICTSGYKARECRPGSSGRRRSEYGQSRPLKQ